MVDRRLMKLSAEDLRQAHFQKKMRGLDPDEVSGCLESAAQRLEELEAERVTLMARLESAEAELLRFQKRDEELRQGMKRSEEELSQARREAELIISEANLKAEALLAEGESRRSELAEELRQLTEQRQRFSERMHKLLSDQQNLLDAIDEELDSKKGSPEA